MTRMALVTGGTRGIGAAVSHALKAAGYSVAATYAGNSNVAEAFTAETGIHFHQWDIGDFDASAARVSVVEAELGFTKALALETARLGITVNAICPGYIHTEMLDAVPADVLEKSILPQIPVGRPGKPEEIARAAVFLAADEAGFITGSTLSVNGGQYMI